MFAQIAQISTEHAGTATASGSLPGPASRVTEFVKPRRRVRVKDLAPPRGG